MPAGARTRTEAIAALRLLIQGERDAAFGFDFPFGLPRQLVDESTWRAFALNFSSRFDRPEDFRSWCWERAGRKELRRETDIECKTPFSAYNLRIFRQTFYGIRDLLAPLLRDRAASVVPMEPADPGRPWLLEICPASTLKTLGRYDSYKHPKARQERKRLAELVLATPGISAKEDVVAALIDDARGDALDSAIAACAAYRAVMSGLTTPRTKSTAWRVEGQVFA